MSCTFTDFANFEYKSKEATFRVLNIQMGGKPIKGHCTRIRDHANIVTRSRGYEGIAPAGAIEQQLRTIPSPRVSRQEERGN